MYFNKPLVTVYMPTHNRLALLKRSLESIVSQTYNPIEIIVVDDGSSDGTFQYLSSLNYENLKIIRNDKPRGACFSRNKAINIAKGLFITGCDDDDFFEKDRIAVFIDNISLLSGEVGFFYSGYKFFGSKKYNFSRKKSVKFDDLILENYVGNQIFCRTADLRDIGGFDESLKSWQDYECWLNFTKNKGIGILIKNTSYVIDQSSAPIRISGSTKIIKSFEYICNKYKLSVKDMIGFKSNYYCYSGVDIEIKDIILAFKFGFFRRYLYMLAYRLKIIISSKF